MLLRFRFDFVFGELKLCGLHTSEYRLENLYRLTEFNHRVRRGPPNNSQLSTLNSQLGLQLPKGLQELFVFDPVGVILRECAASACHELKCKAARLDVLALTLPKQRILVKDPERIGMSRT